MNTPVKFNRRFNGRRLVVLALAFFGAGWFQVLPAQQQAPAASPQPETIRLATYNIEHFNEMFDQGLVPRDEKDWDEFFRDQEDLYEVARVINEQLDADILAVQECCAENHLQYFNRKWLKNRYEFIKVFKGNSPREQYLGILAKKGFEPLEIVEFSQEPDPVNDPELLETKQGAGLDVDNLLFSRGPAFVKFRTPGGHVLWVGVTHVKSRYGDNPAVTKWRIREVQRTREICGELIAKSDTKLLAMVGDFNDDLGLSTEHEKALQADAVGTMLTGQGDQRLICLTDKLDVKIGTYHAQLKTRYKPIVFDHIFLSPALARYTRQAEAISTPLATVASDHYPVFTDLRLPGTR